MSSRLIDGIQASASSRYDIPDGLSLGLRPIISMLISYKNININAAQVIPSSNQLQTGNNSFIMHFYIKLKIEIIISNIIFN